MHGLMNVLDFKMVEVKGWCGLRNQSDCFFVLVKQSQSDLPPSMLVKNQNVC